MNSEKITTWMLAKLVSIILIMVIATFTLIEVKDLRTQLDHGCNCKDCNCKDCNCKDCNCKDCNCCRCGENKDKNVDADLPENPRYPNGRKTGNVDTKTKEK